MQTYRFWRDAGERALKSAAQAAIVVFGGDAINVWAIDWQQSTGVVLSAALLSILTSIVSANVGETGTASLVESTGRHARDDG